MKTIEQDAALHEILAAAIAQAQSVDANVRDAAVAAAEAFIAALASDLDEAPTISIEDLREVVKKQAHDLHKLKGYVASISILIQELNLERRAKL